MPEERNKIMMVGVLPPPVHGQSLATQVLFDADGWPLEKIIVPIRSSKSLDSVGKLSLSKALGLIPLIARTWARWLVHRPKVLYYTAGSGAWVPFIRDLVFLLLCRPLFRITIIHYHSGNLMDFLSGSKWKHTLGSWIYGRGAWTIRLGKSCPAPDYPGNRVFDVPNGLDLPVFPPQEISSAPVFRILFLGNLYEEKGVIDLISAVGRFASSYPDKVALSLIGGWPDETTRRKVTEALSRLPANVSCPNPQPLYGEDKWTALRENDIMVFPTYYRAENLPLVVIEAMAASVPVIASDWRGMATLIEDGVTGLLVPPKDPEKLADAIRRLASSTQLRQSMAKAANLKYQREFTAATFVNSIHQILKAATVV